MYSGMVISAFSPAHITGFFEIIITKDNLMESGSRGAGFSISLGVETKVSIKENNHHGFVIFLNGCRMEELPVSEYVIKKFQEISGNKYFFTVEHVVNVPVGSGFGTSGAGALSLSLALNEALTAGLSRTAVVGIAHEAEIFCKTGLGTVVAENQGGLEVRIKPGSLSFGLIKKLNIEDNYSVVALHYGPLPTSLILNDPKSLGRINGIGGKFVSSLLSNPSVEEFMKLSRIFSDYCGFMTEKISCVIQDVDCHGFTSSMAMFGETIFSVVKKNESSEIVNIFKKHTSQDDRIIITEMDQIGARLI